MLNNAWLVVEACQGQPQSRVDILGEVDSMLPTDCILALTSSSTSSLIFARTATGRRHLTCYIRYSLLPNNRAVELLPYPETDPGILSFLTERHQKMGLISAVSHGNSKRMVMDRIWAAVKREVLTVLAEGVSDPEEVDTLWSEMFSDPTVGPCAMMDAEGLDEAVAIEDEYVEERLE